MEIQRRVTTRPTVLLVGSGAREWARDALDADVDLEVADGADAARDRAAADVVDCVVVAPTATDRDAETGGDSDGDFVTSDGDSATSDGDSATSEADSATSDGGSVTSDGNSATANGDSATAETLSHADAIALIEALTEAAPDLPIVYAPPAADGVAASEATAAGATEYLPRSLAGGAPATPGDPTISGSPTDVEGLQARVERLVEDYDRRRQAAMEQEMLRELLGNAPFSIYFKDREARHVAVTSHTTASFDQTFTGKTDYELYADEVGEELARESLEDDLRVVETGEPVIDREERHVTPEGEELWLRTTKFPWRNEDDEIVGVIGMTRDVTEVKHRERELEAEKRRLEQFASFASHDLRNPVSIAQGYLEQAMTGDGDVEDAHEVVAESLDRMDQLIDDLLNMVRPEEDREIDGWADLASVAERAWEVGGDDAATLELDLPERSEIYAAEGALRQLLENVFSNAVEHGSTSPPSQAREDTAGASSGEPSVADERSSSSPGSQARQDADAPEDAIDHGGEDVTVEVGFTDTGFYVADDGPGIPEEDRDQVFDYGYTTGGTGVGLAITSEIAEAHGWTPRVAESEAGGATFVFDGVIRRPPPLEEVPLSEPVAFDRTTDVDGATPPGEAQQVADDAWTLRGGGENLWGDLETFFALHGTAAGDCRIEARITSLESVHEYSKAGVLLAGAVEPGALLAFAGLTASHGAETAWRTDAGGMVDTAQFDAVEGVPAYLRIDRVGDRVTCWVSVDGEEWTPLDQTILPLAETVAVGLAVCSHTPERRCETSFEEVRVVGLEAEAAGDADDSAE